MPGPRLAAVGLVCTDLARTVAFYRRLGCDLPDPTDAPWGMRYATVRDPDGVRVDLYADLP